MTTFPASHPASARAYVFAAWALAMLASLGSLFIGEVMGMVPCNLCWYQRCMMFGLPFVLGFACYEGSFSGVKSALVLAVIGSAVAVFHSLYYAGLIPRSVQPCGAGPSCADDKLELFSTLVIPYMSAAVFMAIAVLLWAALSIREPKAAL